MLLEVNLGISWKALYLCRRNVAIEFLCGLVSVKYALVLGAEQFGKEPTGNFGFVV